MELQDAVQRIQLGESLHQLAEARREELRSDCGLKLEEARPSTFRKEAEQWICKLARHLGDRHSGDPRIAEVLAAWTLKVDDYDVFDALLSPRVYKPGMPFEKVCSIIRESAGSHFDPVIVKAFEACAEDLLAIFETNSDAADADSADAAVLAA